MPVEKVISENKGKMAKAVDFFRSNLKSVRSGRASAGLLDNIKVDYYGTPTPLKQLATIAVPQADMVVIKPFDPASLSEIEKAIKNSDLSIAPLLDGKIIRLSIPPLSGERRKQLVSQVKQTAEQTKVSLRNIRRDVNKSLEQEQKNKTITEDDMERGKKRIDELIKEFTDKIDSAVKHKSDEIMLD